MISNRAKDGFSNEKDFVKKLNSDKNHRYWKILNLNDNKDLFFVKVEGKKFCKTTKENILPKSLTSLIPIPQYQFGGFMMKALFPLSMACPQLSTF